MAAMPLRIATLEPRAAVGPRWKSLPAPKPRPLAVVLDKHSTPGSMAEWESSYDHSRYLARAGEYQRVMTGSPPELSGSHHPQVWKASLLGMSFGDA